MPMPRCGSANSTVPVAAGNLLSIVEQFQILMTSPLQWMDAPHVDWRAALKQVQCPALLITGDVARGVIISPAQAEEAQALNAKLQVANIAGTGHCIRRDDFAPRK